MTGASEQRADACGTSGKCFLLRGGGLVIAAIWESNSRTFQRFDVTGIRSFLVRADSLMIACSSSALTHRYYIAGGASHIYTLRRRNHHYESKPPQRRRRCGQTRH